MTSFSRYLPFVADLALVLELFSFAADLERDKSDGDRQAHQHHSEDDFFVMFLKKIHVTSWVVE